MFYLRAVWKVVVCCSLTGAIAGSACFDGSGSMGAGGRGGADSGGSGAVAGIGGQGAFAGSQDAGAAAGKAGGGMGGVIGSAGISGTCSVVDEGETGMQGLALLYRSNKITDFYKPAGIDGPNVYFIAGSDLFSYPIAGGEATKLGAAPGSHHIVKGGRVYYTSIKGNESTGRVLSAPVANPAMTVTLAESIAAPEHVVADDTALYFDRRNPASIFKLPFMGGPPAELVPGGQPLGLVAHGTHLYWMDFKSDQLERVPIAGGERQPLVTIFFGGPMAAAGDSIYWADTSRKTIERWVEGAKTTQVLANLSRFDSPPAVAAFGTTLYWPAEGRCGDVYQAQAGGTTAKLITSGIGRPVWVGATDKHLFLLGSGGLYRADRP